MMALNMSPSCTYDEALSRLYKHTREVFEALLNKESKMIVGRVNRFREARVYPRMRAKLQLQGNIYVEKLKAAFARRAPELAEHLRKRRIFADYMLECGIFTNAQLDRQYRDLLNELGARYLLRMQEYERWAVIGDRKTLVGSEDFDAGQLSQQVVNGLNDEGEIEDLIDHEILSSGKEDETESHQGEAVPQLMIRHKVPLCFKSRAIRKAKKGPLSIPGRRSKSAERPARPSLL